MAFPLGFWLLAFGCGFTWLLVLVSLGFGIGRSLHWALGEHLDETLNEAPKKP